MNVLYGMPGQSHRLFVNVVHACPNRCMFCVDFVGDKFFGFDLKKRNGASAADIVEAITEYPRLSEVREIYFCGIGEPLLRYDVVTESCVAIRQALGSSVLLALNTSGTHYRFERRLDVVRHLDLLQISLNADTAQKYEDICRPRFKGAYETVRSFMDALHAFIRSERVACRVELSVVDLSEREFLPESARAGPVIEPDYEACKRIADSYGWGFKVKKLLRDCHDEGWIGFADSWSEWKQLDRALVRDRADHSHIIDG